MGRELVTDRAHVVSNIYVQHTRKCVCGPRDATQQPVSSLMPCSKTNSRKSRASSDACRLPYRAGPASGLCLAHGHPAQASRQSCPLASSPGSSPRALGHRTAANRMYRSARRGSRFGHLGQASVDRIRCWVGSPRVAHWRTDEKEFPSSPASVG